MNFVKFERSRFIKKTSRPWEIHRDLKSNLKNYIEDEIYVEGEEIFFLGGLIYLYIKTRTFWLVNSEMDGHNVFFFGKAKPSPV